ncbi:ABC transporter substrate-binding protein [Plantibacter sp. Mn2098]|uniref:ABC transporter substrate-binding protein n=1 Tax=Plantibacter sp. Mn2098 TaxID=3395266 RepID=UPI003BDB0E27
MNIRVGRFGGIFAAGAIAALVLTGCASGTAASSSDDAKPRSGGSITIARLGAEVTSLDPVPDTLTSNNAYTLDKVFDTLVVQNGKGEIEPRLASAYTTSADGLTWTFTLRKDLTFSDGSALTSADVAYSIQRHLDKGGALPLSAPITAVTATDPQTVTITLSQPYSPLLAELSTFSSGIVPKDLKGESEAAFFAAPVASGPFTVGNWDKAGGKITLKKNADYWQHGKPYVDSVTYIVAGDDNQLAQLVKSGQAQIAEGIAPASVSDLQSAQNVHLLSTPSWNQDEIFFNTTTGPFADRSARRAVAQAIDRAALAKNTTFGTATAGTTYIPSTVQYSDQKATVLGYSIDDAKKDLAAATSDTGKVTLLVESGSQSRDQQAQVIQSQLGKIGITVDIKSVDNATFWTEFPAGNYQFALTTVIADTSDPDNVTTWQVDGAGPSKAFHTGYNNPQVNELAAQGRITPNGDARQKIYAQLQEIVAQDVPNLSLDYTAQSTATSTAVHGLTVVPNGTSLLDGVWLSK